MEITLKDLINLTKELPENGFKEAFDKLTEIKERLDSKKESKTQSCPNCGSITIVKNGKKRNKQAYICRDCKKSFVETTGSAIVNSHCSESVWKQVIRDTVEGIPLDKTASSLDLAHSTVFNMRHKILCCVEEAIIANPVKMNGNCETDETYILESVKGKKIPEDYHRKSRKHGAKASKAGLSDEYICVCTSVTGENKCISISANRATPSKQEIEQVFGERLTDDTLILCDGNTNYDVLSEKCTVAHTKRINKVNGFHSFIKERYHKARGFATTYLNRYNALFSLSFANLDAAANEIYSLMTKRSNLFFTVQKIKSHNLLSI